MKKLTSIIRSLNESKNADHFLQYINEALSTKPGYSPDNAQNIFEDLKKIYHDDFESAKKYFDQNFQ